MQENGQNQSPHKYKEAAGFYEPIVKRNYEQILNVEAVVLGFQLTRGLEAKLTSGGWNWHHF